MTIQLKNKAMVMFRARLHLNTCAYVKVFLRDYVLFHREKFDLNFTNNRINYHYSRSTFSAVSQTWVL